MKSLKEQLAKLFNRTIPDTKKKSERPPKNKALKAKKTKPGETSKSGKKKKAGKNPVKAKNKLKQNKRKRSLRNKPPSFSVKAIHDAYHPSPSRKKLLRSASAESSDQKEGQNQRKLKAAKPYGQYPSNQCAHCEKPAMDGYDVCLRCSQN